ncbi:unnamed protein product, partial [Timema podura]|nr:unnamed protein product [Timema podura]
MSNVYASPIYQVQDPASDNKSTVFRKGLRHGQITSQHIVQQLQNPAMQHRHREVLVNILKFQMRLQR